MRVPNFLLFVLLALAVDGAGAQDATLSASVDRGTISENESFTYVLRAEGQVAGEPDISAIERDFDILSRSTSARIQTLNGRTEQVVDYVYQLLPRGPGTFSVPPIELDGLLSNAVEVLVEPVVVDTDAPADIFMEVEVDPSQAFELAQVVYTLKLFVGVGIGRATLTPPVIEGAEAIVERLGEDRQYQTTRGDRSFTVRERRYAIFPQSAGTLEIGPSAFEAMVIPARGFSRVQRLRSDSVAVEVKPAVAPPASHPDAVWLPARSLELTETWADGGDDFVLGVPRTRVLKVVADGLLETQLPELGLGVAEGVRQYPDQPELGRQVTEAGLEASRTERYAVIAQRVGAGSIPPAELPWWNVVEERWEVATVEGRQIDVAPGNEPTATEAPLAEDAPAALVVRSPGPWRWVAAALATGWLITALAWWYSVRSSVQHGSADLRPVKPRSLRAITRELKAACAVDDGGRARELLLEWGRHQYEDEPPANLGALARASGGPLGDAIEALESALYGQSGQTWSGARLADLIAAAGTVDRGPKTPDKDPLEPLYR